jgi:hypothetical protein
MTHANFINGDKLKITLVCIAILLFIANNTLSQTYVSGIIGANTTWSDEGSPYILTDRVQIANNVKLTILDNVVVKSSRETNIVHRIEVFGTLEAVSSNRTIHLNNIIIIGGKNTSSESFYINIENSNLTDSNLLPPGGGAQYGYYRIVDNFLTRVNFRGIMYLWYPVEDVLIRGNIFFNSGAIHIALRNQNEVDIVNNIFYNDHNFVKSTQFPGSDYGVTSLANYNSIINVNNNSFLDTNRVALGYLPGYTNANFSDATNNFWGNTSDIQRMIFDKNDDLSTAGYINFEPFLNQPHPDTPNFPFVTIPSLNSPRNDSLGAPSLVTFIWNSDVNADHYQIQISTDGFKTMSYDETTTYSEYPNFKLNYATEYQWRVRAINSISASDWSEVWELTTDNRKIELSSPLNEATAIELGPKFIWRKNSAFESYTVQISTDNFSTLLVSEVVADTTYTTPQLNYSTQYQWRVRGATADENGEWSEPWSFTTIIQAPDKPVLLSPNDAITNLTVLPKLTWGVSDRAEHYQVQLSKHRISAVQLLLIPWHYWNILRTRQTSV